MSDGPSQLVVDPRDERLIHRLDAFSDIVIGLSQAAPLLAFVTFIIERVAVPRIMAKGTR